MARTATRFSCTACGEVLPKWEGRCPSCDAWGTVQEEATTLSAARRGHAAPRDAVRDRRPDVHDLTPSRIRRGGVVPPRHP